MIDDATLEKLKKFPPEYQEEVKKLIESLEQQKDVVKSGNRPIGLLKGFVTYMAPDFDAPLEEFKDYM